jgi:F0F1-type ATP synthase membrane subunit c/vacuolar-type H+-ATPase subunit K
VKSVMKQVQSWLGVVVIVVGALVLIASLAAPGLGVGKAISDAFTGVTRLFEPSVTVGRYGLPLKDGEQTATLSREEANAALAQRAASSSTLDQLLPGVAACVEVQNPDDAGVLLVCALTELSQSIAIDVPMPPEAGIPYIEMIRAQQQRLSVDADVQASWIPEGEELKEHRETLLADGYAVGTGIISATFGERTVMGTILEWSGGAEWIGYLWVGGDTYLVWGWAPDRAALDALLTR